MSVCLNCDVYFCGDQLNIHSNFLCLSKYLAISRW